MSYDNRNHRGYHPYQRDQRYKQNDYRSNYRPDDRRNNYNNDYHHPGRGSHGDGHSGTGGPYVHAYGWSGNYQSSGDRRYYPNGGNANYGHQQTDHRLMCPPQNQWQPFQQHHSPYSSTSSDNRSFTRHSTGSSDYDGHSSRFREAVGISNYRRESAPTSFSSSNERRSTSTASDDLQSRTLVVKQFHQNVTKELLKELFIQVGPVRNVVLRPDHAFIEFQDSDSVAYALAAMDNVHMFGQPLRLEPKLNDPNAFRFLETLKMFQKDPALFGVVIQ